MATSRRLRALITNDDGIDSPGLHALAGLALGAGFDVVVAAPHVDTSGVGGSVSAIRVDGGVRIHPRELPGLDGVPAWAVEGHPAFIVHSVGRGWLERPDVVLSGVNYGSNVGRAILHSGTVGAALTAGLHGVRGLAVSLDSGWAIPEHPHWDAVAHVLPEVLETLLADEPGTVLSLNVPDRAPGELGPLREAALVPFGAARIRVAQSDGPDGPVLRASGEPLALAPEDGTDVALLAAGHPTVTRLQQISAAPLPVR